MRSSLTSTLLLWLRKSMTGHIAYQLTFCERPASYSTLKSAAAMTPFSTCLSHHTSKCISHLTTQCTGYRKLAPQTVAQSRPVLLQLVACLLDRDVRKGGRGGRQRADGAHRLQPALPLRPCVQKAAQVTSPIQPSLCLLQTSLSQQIYTSQPSHFRGESHSRHS